MPHRMLHPSVYISGQDSTGSGTIIFSKQLTTDSGRLGRRAAPTYVLTNLHVVDGNLLFRFARKSRQSAKGEKTTARERWEVTRIPLTVRIFDFKAAMGPLKHKEYKADIVACDKEQDLALLKLRTSSVFPQAILAAREVVFEWFSENAWAVGCPSDSHPFPTEGKMAGISKERLFSTTPVHSGSSGGGLYCLSTEQKRFELVGVTTEMGLNEWNPVSHMAYSIPVKTVYEFLERNGFGFIAKQTHETAAE